MSFDRSKYEASKEPDYPPDAAIWPEVRKLWDLYGAVWDEKCAFNPVEATIMGDYRFNANLSSNKREDIDTHLAELKRFKNKVRRILVNKLPPVHRVHHEYLSEMLKFEVMMFEKVPMYELPTQHLFGPHLLIVQAASFHPWRDSKDCETYFSRLRAFGNQIDQIIEGFKHGLSTKTTLPKSSVEAMIEQCKAQLLEDPEKSPVYKMAKDKVESVEGNSAELVNIVKDIVIPAFQRLHDFLSAEYLEGARTEAGIWAFPGGADMYRACILFFTSLDKPAQDLHDLGLEEVERITKKMDEVRALLGDTEGTQKTFARKIAALPENQPKDGEEIISTYKEILDVARVRVLELFRELPAAELEVKPVEEFRQQASPAAHYYPPPADRSRPGIFYANTYKPETRPKYSMEAIALHEGLPGHHMQIAIAQELKELPRLRKQVQDFTIGYVEGWGLYTEYLGEQLRFYEDPLIYYGRLLTEIWRAARLVVDTGLHSKKWTREQAIEYLCEYACLADNEAAVEVDRFMVMPGQALAYKTGEIFIINLLKKARRELGPKFSWQDFHDKVLENGAVPLELLRRTITSYIGAAKATSV
uniref:DUF885 domain-containing protein n=2 Tax=Rhodosorus marinus TaxID=101924 RepID=A0A7S2ZKG5_9RHOD|mmetsp:Transcript_22800/g.91301  ORF Transcript_22800/g.91301 Transcript_22800/m.91301 type:complete len:588 (+) Transcript_22800:40-1803(+)